MEQFNTHSNSFYQFMNSGSNELTFSENKGINLIHILEIFSVHKHLTQTNGTI